MPENAIIPDGEAVQETAREKFERERLSRRQALKRLGMTSAMATFALFSVDDLARMVGQAMQQRAGDNKVAAQIAKEFQQAGITLADGGTSQYPCVDCNDHYNNTCLSYPDVLAACVQAEISPTTPTHTQSSLDSALADCRSLICAKYNNALYELSNCLANNNCPHNPGITPDYCVQQAV